MVWLYFLALLAMEWGYTVKGINNGLKGRREEYSGRLLNSDGDFEFTYTTPELQDKTLCVPSYTVTVRHDHRCGRESQCEVNQCDNGGTCVKNGHKETCHCMEGYSGEFCSEGGSSVGNLEFTHRPQDRNVKRQKQAVVLCMITKFNEQNEGQYTCLARAGSLTAEHVFSMTMVNDCNLEGFRGPRNEEGKVGNMVFLTCSASNAKDVLWRKDGVVIDFEENTRMKTKGTTPVKLHTTKIVEARRLHISRSFNLEHSTSTVADLYMTRQGNLERQPIFQKETMHTPRNTRGMSQCSILNCIDLFPGGKEAFTPENVQLNFGL
ncbi:hypothetical protein MAR_011177 [Mya arenaria]|uniref:EGF-like domain-containing protein n=1 Tax=Mya arenaria TaxID=6604 RepID=A0ABY7FTB9_MYAAR|nr:hypothetical protein MAR_011177 [Mya arenaria]